ncbi:MAG: hypothetical protein WCS51_02495 [Bacilli bacterium]
MATVLNLESQLTDADKNVGLLIASKDVLINIDSYSESVNNINELFENIRNNFFDLGKELSKVKESKSYKIGNYKDVYEFSKSEFNLEVTSTKNFINVYSTFKNDNGCLSDKFQNFNLSQLVEMLPLADDKEFCSELGSLTVKEIKSVKKQLNTIDATVEGKWNSLITVVKNIVLDDVCTKNKKLFGKFHNDGSERQYSFDNYESAVIKLDGYGRLFIKLNDFHNDMTLHFSVECFKLKYFSPVSSSFKDFKKNITAFIDELIKESDAIENVVKSDKSKVVDFVESEVVEDLPVKELKVCTLKNDSAREDFINNPINWKIYGSVKGDLNISIFQFIKYPEYFKIFIGSYELDPFKIWSQGNLFSFNDFNAQMGGKGFLSMCPLSSLSNIVERLKRERY